MQFSGYGFWRRPAGDSGDLERTEEKISPRELTLIFKKDLFEQSELSFLKIVLSQFPGALFFPIRETEPESPAGRLQIRLRKPSVSVLLSQIPLLVLGEAETVHGSGQGSLCVIILLYASFLAHLFFRPLFLFLSRRTSISSGLSAVSTRSVTRLFTISANPVPTAISFHSPCFHFHACNSHFNGDHHIFMMGEKSYLSIRRRNNQIAASSFIKNFIACNYFQTKCIHLHQLLLCFCLLCLRLCNNIINCPHIEESRFRIFVHFSFNNHLKSADGLFQRHIFSRNTGKCLCHEERAVTGNAEFFSHALP